MPSAQPVAKPPPPEQPPVVGNRPRLLLVDDQPLNNLRLRQIFAKDYELSLATNGADALALCRSLPPDLILLDVVMPDMDGHEVCRRLKSDPATQHIPVIFVTGHSDPEQENRGFALGAADFIAKPVNPTVVRARVRTQLALKSQTDLLRDSEARLLDFANLSADWYWETDAALRVTYQSNNGQRAAGVMPLDPGQPPALQALYQTRQPVRNFELRDQGPNGEARWSRLNALPRFDAAGQFLGYRGTGSDITLIREYAQQLERMAHFDALTGLPNRVLLNDRLHQAMLQSQRRNHSVAVAYLDLDGFKAVNDLHGHDVGDLLLIQVAQRMKMALREGDTLARIGGDEFIAVLVDLERPRDFEPVLARLLQAAAEPFRHGESQLHVSASIGLTVFPLDDADADQLVRHADQAMYQAKQAGRNRYHLFDLAEDAAAQGRRKSLEEIHQGLLNSQFVLYFQPKVNMQTGALVGAEALVRWLHPQRGLVPPALFLPQIEDHPMALDLGDWVLRSALSQMSRWRAEGLALPVSVNVGARQLQQSDFGERLGKLLAEFPDVPSNSLELEILETSALADIEPISRVMEECRHMGVHFALDDFGTGYSSLTYLKRLPAEVLKIDRSFVNDMLVNPDDMAIVSGVIGLARAFQREVIAEGVETEAQGDCLLNLGCQCAQGFVIARPMPAKDVQPWLRSWSPAASWTASSAAARA